MLGIQVTAMSAADLSFDERDSAAGSAQGRRGRRRFDWGDDRPPDMPWREHDHLRGARARASPSCIPRSPRSCAGRTRGWRTRRDRPPEEPWHHRGRAASGARVRRRRVSCEDRSLRNYWGYNTLGVLRARTALRAAREVPGAQVAEFKSMVKALHAAGIEVILDVVYNHTCEGNHLGPDAEPARHRQRQPITGSCRRRATTWTSPARATASTPRNPEAARLIVDSLRYWASEMHVDGFRFDLATTLGRVGARRIQLDTRRSSRSSTRIRCSRA